MSSRNAVFEYEKTLSAAFQKDCERFLLEFEKLQSFNYADFAKVWQKLSFSFIYAGQRYLVFIKDLCEIIFYTVKKYIVFPESLYIKVGAFYLLYGLYYKQPLEQWVKIRLTLNDYKKIKELVSKMSSKKQYDVVYIFAKMRSEDAFDYVATQRPMGPEDRFVKTFEPYYNDTFQNCESDSAVGNFTEFVSSDFLSELEFNDKEYTAALQKYAEKFPSLAPSSRVDIAAEVKDIFQKVCQSSKTDEESESINENKTAESVDEGCGNTENPNSILSRRNQIREKAMGNQDAVYRGSKKVITGVDLNMDIDT